MVQPLRVDTGLLRTLVPELVVPADVARKHPEIVKGGLACRGNEGPGRVLGETSRGPVDLLRHLAVENARGCSDSRSDSV
jgi:hypothetical protein